MKKIILILTLFVLTISVKAQIETNHPEPGGHLFVGLRSTGWLRPPSDTTTNKTGLVRIGTSLYAGNGTYWSAQGTTYTGTSPISVSGSAISIALATASISGYLSSTDWNTFNNKQSVIEGLGVIYNGYNFTNTSDFLDSGSVSPTVSGGEITFVNGGSTFNKTLSISQNTLLYRYTMTAKVKVTGTSNGIFIGMRSSNNFTTVDSYGKILLDGSGNNGQLSIIGYGDATAATSTYKLTVSTNDVLYLTYQRQGNIVSFSARNATTNSAILSVSYTESTTTIQNNTGRFSIGGLSSTANFKLDSLNITSTDTKRPYIMVIGDSKTVGYSATKLSNSWAFKLSQTVPSFEYQAGAGDRTGDVVKRLPVIDSLYPQNVLLNIGRNDIANSIDSNVTKANYTTIVTNLQTNGATVYHLLPFYETNTAQTWLVNWINRTYSAAYIIDTYTPTMPSNCLYSDGIHPSDTGHLVIYNTIVNSFKLKSNLPYFDSSALAGVRSVSATNANGFTWTITNPTTTPVISVTSSVGDGQFIYSNSGALAGSANHKWDNTYSSILLGGQTSNAWTNVSGTIAGGNATIMLGQSTDMWFSSNARYNSGWKYLTSAAAANIGVFQQDVQLRASPSGTAGNALTWYMPIKATYSSGGVAGIGGDISSTTGSITGATIGAYPTRVGFGQNAYFGDITTSPNSTADVGGSFGAAITTTSSNLTLDATHHTVIITGGTPTITLPAAPNARRMYVLVNQTGSAVTIGAYLDFAGASATTIPANSSITIQSNGSNFYRIR